MTGLYQYYMKDVFGAAHIVEYTMKREITVTSYYIWLLVKILLRYHKSSNAIDLKNLFKKSFALNCCCVTRDQDLLLYERGGQCCIQ